MSTTDETVPGMADSITEWLAAYRELFIEREGYPTTDSERHARNMEEVGLLGRAWAIIHQVQEAERRRTRGLAVEPYRDYLPRRDPGSSPAAAAAASFHPFGADPRATDPAGTATESR